MSRGGVVTHGMTKSSEYKIWCAMKKRCNNPNDSHYEHYGGRGITVCDDWQGSFTKFYEDMGARPTPKHSIDRIDVNGNYEPSNCRWATPHEQMTNRRMFRTNTTGHNGVVYDKRYKTWVAKVGLNGESIYLGSYKTIEKAVAARKAYDEQAKNNR